MIYTMGKGEYTLHFQKEWRIDTFKKNVKQTGECSKGRAGKDFQKEGMEKEKTISGMKCTTLVMGDSNEVTRWSIKPHMYLCIAYIMSSLQLQTYTGSTIQAFLAATLSNFG